MSTDEHPDTEDLAKDTPRGDGLATGAVPGHEGSPADPGEAVAATIRGGEGLATGSAPQEGVDPDDAPDPDATVSHLPRGGEGLADDAA